MIRKLFLLGILLCLGISSYSQKMVKVEGQNPYAKQSIRIVRVRAGSQATVITIPSSTCIGSSAQFIAENVASYDSIEWVVYDLDTVLSTGTLSDPYNDTTNYTFSAADIASGGVLVWLRVYTCGELGCVVSSNVGDQFLSFAVNSGINEIFNNIYQGTGAVNFTYTGLADQKIPAGENGKIYFTHDTDSGVCIMGFNTQYEDVNYTGYEYGVFASGPTTVSRVTNGTLNSLTGEVIAGGNLVGLERSNDTISIIKSLDAGATWVKLYTFATLYSGDLYPSITLRSTGPYIMKYPYIDLESSYTYYPQYNYVLFLNGQSNAVGNNAESTLFDTLQNNGINKIWWETSFSNQASGVFQNMNVPTNTSGHPSYAASDSVGWGVEQIVGNYFRALFGDTIYTVKFALGSRAISQWEPESYMWDNMERFTVGALASDAMTNNIVLGNVWMQGEQDVYDGTHETYYLELDTLLSNYRGIDANLNDCRWINIKLKSTASLGANAATRIPFINAGFDSLAANNTNVFNVSTEDIQMKWDNIHYRYDGIYDISHKIINVILGELKIEE